MPGWFNSIRAIALLIFVIGLTAGFMLGKVSDQLYMSAAMVALTGYFAKRGATDGKGNPLE